MVSNNWNPSICRADLTTLIINLVNVAAPVCLREYVDSKQNPPPHLNPNPKRNRRVSTYQMWDSSGMGSLDLVKKFFTTAPKKNSQRWWNSLILWFSATNVCWGCPYPGPGPPGRAAGFWTGSCNTPAVLLWSSRGHHHNNPTCSVDWASLQSKPEQMYREMWNKANGSFWYRIINGIISLEQMYLSHGGIGHVLAGRGVLLQLNDWSWRI